MLEPTIPWDEANRLATLRGLNILDTPPEERFDRLARIAQRILDVPIVVVSLVDSSRQWFKSCQGLDITETPRSISFCGHAILSNEAFVIPDAARDFRFADNPLVTGAPHIRFYAGQPIKANNGSRLGTLCIIDKKPRQLSQTDLDILRDFATLVENELNFQGTVETQDFLLQQSKERFYTLLMATVQIVWTTNAQGEVIEDIPSWREFTGQSGKEIKGWGWINALHPDDVEQTTAIWRQAVATHTLFETDYRIRRHDGVYRHFDVRGVAVYEKDGSIREWIGSCTDITERNKTENALRLNQFVVDHSSVEVYRINSEGCILYANEQACHALGYSQDEMLTLSIPDINPAVQPEPWQDHWQNLRKNKTVFIESLHRRKDGSIRPVEVSVNYVKYDGQEYNISFVRDITERKQADEQIQRLTRLYKALYEINQAIVRMGQQAELFPLVCRCAVEFGGMSMAWVGQLDEASGSVVTAAAHGENLDYLDGLVVSSNSDMVEGRGPVGIALRENQSVVINNFFTNSITAPWQERAAKIGLSSMAAFPIQRGGRPFAALIVYHTQLDAFDAEAISLLGKMSKVISFALDNFDREVQRKIGEESLRLAASVFEASSEAIMVASADNRIIAINPAFTDITGYLEEDILGSKLNILKSERHDDAFYQAMWQEINATGKWQGEIWGRRKSGEVYPKWLTINTVSNGDELVLHRIALFTDISQKKESEERIWQQANFDLLTELPNRQMFHDRLDQDVKKAHRAGIPLALMFIDLDRFKEVNDTLGYDVGDALLKEAANRLSSCVRETDTVARLGGDEFTVILGELDDPGSIDRVAQNILRKLSEPFQLGNEVAYVSASIGITLYPEDATDVEALLKSADQAMYAAKSSGRNRHNYFTPSMHQAALTRMQIANDLHGALARNEFWIAYQPITELATGSIHKAEALIRWQHPTRGLISPAEFIAIAEETGLIGDIGDWVFREAAQQVKLWRTTYHPEFQISVNKSPVQFNAAGNIHAVWVNYLKQLDLPGQSITVEITEGLLLDANATITDKLFSFRDAGIQVSLDDFGTGYSSLSYLKKFDIDYLKIDQSFTRNLAPDSDDMALCEAIIVMAHKLGIKVIAEGVETEQQKNLLTAAGCDYAQGYLFSKPVPTGEFVKLL